MALHERSITITELQNAFVVIVVSLPESGRAMQEVGEFQFVSRHSLLQGREYDSSTGDSATSENYNS